MSHDENWGLICDYTLYSQCCWDVSLLSSAHVFTLDITSQERFEGSSSHTAQVSTNFGHYAITYVLMMTQFCRICAECLRLRRIRISEFADKMDNRLCDLFCFCWHTWEFIQCPIHYIGRVRCVSAALRPPRLFFPETDMLLYCHCMCDYKEKKQL